MTQRLALKTERLTELTPGDLASVQGAGVPLPTQACTGAYPTFNCTVIVTVVTGIVTTTTS